MKLSIVFIAILGSLFSIGLSSVMDQPLYAQQGYTTVVTPVPYPYTRKARRWYRYPTTVVGYQTTQPAPYAASYVPVPYAAAYGAVPYSPSPYAVQPYAGAVAAPGPAINGSVPAGQPGGVFTPLTGSAGSAIVNSTANSGTTNSNFQSTLSDIDPDLSKLLSKYNISDTYTKPGTPGPAPVPSPATNTSPVTSDPASEIKKSISTAIQNSSGSSGLQLTQAQIDAIVKALETQQSTLPRKANLSQIATAISGALGQLDNSALLGPAQPWLKLAFNLLNAVQPQQSGAASSPGAGVSPTLQAGSVLLDSQDIMEHVKKDVQYLLLKK